MTKTLLIDAQNILMRSVFAARDRVQLSADGVNTAPLLIFINLVSKYVRAVDPERVVLCWDGGRSRFRIEVFPEYKSERATAEVNDEFEEAKRTQQFLAREFLSLAGLHHVRMDGVEADDLIAYYWSKRQPDERITILSGDKDFLQLLDGFTDQYRPTSGDAIDTEHWTPERVEREMECKPEHLRLVMALTGDKIDGVPGIPGFGAKTACKLLAQYDWNFGVFLDSDHPKLKGRQSEAVRNLTLVDLRMASPTHCGIDLPPLPPFRPTSPESALWGDLMAWCSKYQMESIRTRLVEARLWKDAPVVTRGQLDLDSIA